MLFSSVPVKMPTLWASSAAGAQIRTVPVVPSGQVGAASFQLGFPPPNFAPVASGGTAPFGQDFNGIFNAVTAWLRWQQAGGPIVYDSAFSTAISGYPNGAILQSATTPGISYQSLVDGNTVNPDSGPSAQWLVMGGGATLAGDVSGSLTSNVIGAGKVTGTKIANATVTNTNLANMASATLKGNNLGGSGPPLDLTVTQILTMLGINISGVLSQSGNLNLGIPSVGTIIFQWGAYLATLNTEAQVNVTIPAFPNDVLWYIGIGINNSNSTVQDLWVQNVQNQIGPSPAILPFFLQATSPTPGHIDGIMWFAIGY